MDEATPGDTARQLPAGNLSKPSSPNMQELSDDQKAKVSEVFSRFDKDGSGAIDATELKSAMTVFLKRDLSDDDVEKMISDVDGNMDGTIQHDEFMHMMTAKILGRQQRTHEQQVDVTPLPSPQRHQQHAAPRSPSASLSQQAPGIMKSSSAPSLSRSLTGPGLGQLSKHAATRNVFFKQRLQELPPDSDQYPGAGTYNLPPDERRSKYHSGPKYGFGHESRFGLGDRPDKQTLGPGVYNPPMPAYKNLKVGFPKNSRGRPNPVPQTIPGPGAYNLPSDFGQKQNFKIRGKIPMEYMIDKAKPGPGAYDPNPDHSYKTVKVGFLTSTREDLIAKHQTCAPGPGYYELHQYMTVGCDAGNKFSITSRRRAPRDLTTYVTPAPGEYNSVGTSFPSQMSERLSLNGSMRKKGRAIV